MEKVWPELASLVMLTNMALGIADRLRKATRAISAFDYYLTPVRNPQL